MAPEKEPIERIHQTLNKIADRLEALETAMNKRFENLKQVVSDYLNLGSDFAKGSLITALKQV